MIESDLKQIFRDKTQVVFLFVPLILLLFMRYFVPFLTDRFPLLADYETTVMMFGGIQTAILFGFITSFMILEEKDKNVLQAIRVLPVSSFYFIGYRLAFGTAFSAFGTFLMINLSGIAYPGFGNSLLLSFQYGLIAPFITLIISTYANNKIEGMAFFKGVNLIILIPMLFFFFEGTFRYVAVIIPVFWTYALYAESMASGYIWPYFFTGLIFYLVVLAFLFFEFQKRVFDR